MNRVRKWLSVWARLRRTSHVGRRQTEADNIRIFLPAPFVESDLKKATDLLDAAMLSPQSAAVVYRDGQAASGVIVLRYESDKKAALRLLARAGIKAST
jgi:hypothetical protein